jgi:hypothetical protein
LYFKPAKAEYKSKLRFCAVYITTEIAATATDVLAVAILNSPEIQTEE